MERVTILENDKLSNGWINPDFLPEGKSKYYLRDIQTKIPEEGWRNLRTDEIEVLIHNKNTAADWNKIFVSGQFNPNSVKNSKFYGTVRIGAVTDHGLQYHDLRLPVGITNSSIHSCDIGDHCAIHDVHYLSHYIIGDRCMLFNIQEMCTTDHSKFGNGILKDGEDPSVRVALNVMNENEHRQVYPFDGMNTADAFLQAKFVDDKELKDRLSSMTQERFDNHRGYYGEVGNGCVIKNSSIIKDVKIGECCYIKGASKLKNITINSSDAEPSQIGENVILVNGIVGYGCRLFYGCIGVKFVLGNNCNLKYGARLIDSILGDNSTISCCEVLNNLVFPCHEQHHNNSFLIAALVMGQSNIAAGATIGSNHNSRSNDGEIVAGRGFWPGLCSSVKHSSKFASCTLLAKGDYYYELNIPLPFSLVANNLKNNELVIRPAYWWMNNMYALARNVRKYAMRDKRKTRTQNIEFDIFAPDTMEEVVKAVELLDGWSLCKSDSGDIELVNSGMENSDRKVRIVRVAECLTAYREMLLHYGVKYIVSYLQETAQSSLINLSSNERCTEWINLGGQIVKKQELDRLISDIKNGVLDSWEDVHSRYDELWHQYPLDKAIHAAGILCFLYQADQFDDSVWRRALTDEIRNAGEMKTKLLSSRRKDFDNRFRNAIFRNGKEMECVMGRLSDDEFICRTISETDSYIAALKSYSSLTPQ